MKTQFTLLLALGMSAIGCTTTDKNEPMPNPNSVTVSYAQTSCADPWSGTATTNTDAGFLQAAEQYVQQRGIKLSNLRLKASAAQASCLACVCPTGRQLAAEVPAKDVPALVQLGFKQQ